MLLRRVLPADDGLCDLEADGADELLRRWYAPDGDRSLRLTMIATLDGHAGGDDGVSGSISSPADRRVLTAVRRTADAVVVGAETARREAIGRPRGAALVIVTATGALEGHRLRPASDGAAVMIVTTSSGARRAARAVDDLPHDMIVIDTAGASEIDAREIATAVRERTGPHIVCEGGPRLARQFLDAELVTELCLTTAPAIGGQHPMSPGDDTVRRLRPRQLLVAEDGAIFGRWTLSRDR